MENKYGSKEMGGNGLCYTCHELPAREGKFNCVACAGVKPVPKRGRKLTVSEMQEELRRMSGKDETMKIFGA